MDASDDAAFDSSFCGERGDALERFDVFGTAVRVAGVVHRVDAEKEIRRTRNFGPCERERKKDSVAGGDVGDGNSLPHFVRAAMLGNIEASGQSGATEGQQIDANGAVLLCPERGSDGGGSVEFKAVALSVVEREGVALESLLVRIG